MSDVTDHHIIQEMQREIDELEAERDTILLEYLEHLDSDGLASAENIAEMVRLRKALQEGE